MISCFGFIVLQFERDRSNLNGNQHRPHKNSMTHDSGEDIAQSTCLFFHEIIWVLSVTWICLYVMVIAQL